MHELFELSKEVIGLIESEAISMIKKIDGLYQIEERNGNKLYILEDFRDDRLTMKIKDGIVIEANIC